MGQKWPIIVLLIVYTINACAISWKYILDLYLPLGSSTAADPYDRKQGQELKIYNRTIFISVLFFNVFKFRDFVSPIFIYKLNPYIVRYCYKIYNQQITKLIILLTLLLKAMESGYLQILNVIKFFYCVDSADWKLSPLNNLSFKLLGVGISETIRTHKNKITKIKYLKPSVIGKGFKNMSTMHTQFDNLNSLNLNQIISVKDSHNNEISLKFKQWFAGITDGDGYIYVNKSGNVGFEMTLPSSDEKVLRIIQNKFGGNIHARAGLKAVRYRTQKRDTILKIIHCLNGLVVNNIRLAQLHKACVALNIPIKDPIAPTLDSAYISGLLDSDGSINFYEHKYNDTFRYQLTISIGNKSRCNIEFLISIFGGKIYFDKSNNGFYIWRANSKLLHLKLYDYFLKFPPKTIKVHRTYLIKEFHELNESKVYRDTNILSMNYKIWKKFLIKWNNTN